MFALAHFPNTVGLFPSFIRDHELPGLYRQHVSTIGALPVPESKLFSTRTFPVTVLPAVFCIVLAGPSLVPDLSRVLPTESCRPGSAKVVSPSTEETSPPPYLGPRGSRIIHIFKREWMDGAILAPVMSRQSRFGVESVEDVRAAAPTRVAQKQAPAAIIEVT
jgi:hypothetical protein